jgi:triacylglycerol esterase/lipase EstA (alpha/beta hydrolase family)
VTFNRLPLALLLAVATMLLSVSWIVPSAAAAGNIHRPVLFIHGYAGSGCPGYSATGYFGTMMGFLRDRGFEEGLVPVGYYSCDRDTGASVDGFGDQAAMYGTAGQERAPDGHLSQNRNASIRQLAYSLAWMIYTDYASHSVRVDIVAHSMGGLIVRWMLYRLEAHDLSYPSALYVPEVVTLGTPHGGAGFAAFCSTVQCQEMAPNSLLLNELNSFALDPQATGGTEWTVIGSVGDLVVSDASALNMGHVHRVDYASPAYGHSGFLTDPRAAADAQVTYWAPNDTRGHMLDHAPHSLQWISDALHGSSAG